METQIWCPPAGSRGERLIKGTVASASTYFWEKAAPPALTLMPNGSVPPCMSLVLLSCCPSTGAQRVWVPVSLNAGPLRLQKPFAHSATILAGFYSRKLWILLFLALESWAWVLHGIPGFSGGTSTAEISLLTFLFHMWVWDQPILVSATPTSLHVAFFFFTFLSYRTWVQLDFRWFWMKALL